MSKKGAEQSLALAKRFNNINIDIIKSSPYLRAKQTAEIISKKISVPVEYWDYLRELRRPSELEGLRYDDPRASKIKKIIKKNQKKSRLEIFEW